MAGENFKPLCNNVLSESESEKLAYINIVTSVLSIIGSGSIIIYTVSKRVFRSSEIRPLFHLSLADFLLSVFWLITSAFFLNKDDREKGSRICYYLEVITEMFHIITFFLTVNYAVHVYIKVREGAHHLSNLVFTMVSTDVFYQRLFCILFLSCWILPVVFATPLLVQAALHDNKSCFNCSRCRLLFDRPEFSACSDPGKSKKEDYRYSLYLMVTTLSLSIIVLMVLYYFTWVGYRKSRRRTAIITHSQHVQIRGMRNRIGLFIAAFLFCWLPAMCVVIASAGNQTDGMSSSWFPLLIMQSLTAPTQGFLNCLVYGWTRKNFYAAVEASQNEILSAYYRYDDIDSLQSSGQSDRHDVN